MGQDAGQTFVNHIWLKFNTWFTTCLNAKDGGDPNLVGAYYWESFQRGWSYEGLIGALGVADETRVCPWFPVRDGQQRMLDFMSQALPTHITGLRQTTGHEEVARQFKLKAKFIHPDKNPMPRVLCRLEMEEALGAST
eukprot:6109834-Prorocentrum_lima.AAC.1